MDKSITRVYAYYMIGGCNSIRFTEFLISFCKAYGKAQFDFIADAELQRKFRYVYGSEMVDQIVDVNHIRHLEQPFN